jgi:hypothetical protein
MNNDHQDARMILALAAEADDRFIWDRIRTIQTDMFAVGPGATLNARSNSPGCHPMKTNQWPECGAQVRRGRCRS